MEKRLNLAKRLLKENGIIFISIDDNEVAQLKLLCDKVFDGNTSKGGKTNFIACLPTIMNLKGNNDQFGFAGTHEYTLVYAKNIEKVKINEFDIDEEEVLEKWEEDELGLFKKGANLKSTGVNAPRNKRPNLYFPIFINEKNQEVYITENNKPLNENDIIIYPITNNQEMSWRWSKTKIKNERHNIILVGENGAYSIYKKQRPNIGDLPSKKPKTLFYKPEYSSGNGTALLKDIFSDKVFDNPKPLELIKDILILSTNKDSLVLDFMAGSGTTGQAVMELNKIDNGNRKFILCTNNELNGIGSKLSENEPNKNKYELGICNRVTYPRLKKVITGYNNIEGINSNLQYFKTNFIKRTNSRDQVRFDLTNKCTEMLCVKDNIFNLEKEAKNYKIFSSNDKKRYLCVYYSFSKNEVSDFISDIKKLNGEKNIYMFSDTKEVDLSLFQDIKDIYIEAVPEPILEIYRELIKLNISK